MIASFWTKNRWSKSMDLRDHHQVAQRVKHGEKRRETIKTRTPDRKNCIFGHFCVDFWLKSKKMGRKWPKLAHFGPHLAILDPTQADFCQSWPKIYQQNCQSSIFDENHEGTMKNLIFWLFLPKNGLKLSILGPKCTFWAQNGQFWTHNWSFWTNLWSKIVKYSSFHSSFMIFHQILTRIVEKLQQMLKTLHFFELKW